MFRLTPQAIAPWAVRLVITAWTELRSPKTWKTTSRLTMQSLRESLARIDSTAVESAGVALSEYVEGQWRRSLGQLTFPS